MLLCIAIKTDNIFQLFHHIKNDRAALVVHKSGEEAVAETGYMQGRKLPAAGKAVFIYSATVVGQKMAGHTVDHHQFMPAFFQVSRIEFRARLPEMVRQSASFLIRNYDHQAFTTIATCGAIHAGRYLRIQLLYDLIKLGSVAAF